MNEISAARRVDSSRRREAVATSTLLGVLAALLLAQLAPWGDFDVAGTIASVAIGAVGGALIGMFGRQSLLMALDAVLLALYLIVALTPITAPLTTRWIRVDTLPSAMLDAVVVLSAGVKSDSALNSPAADRLLAGLELMRTGHARRLVTTRQIERFRGRTIASDSDQTRLVTMASMADRWTVVDGVHTTRDEAVRSAAVLLPQGARSIAVVTSPLHTRRACAVFEAVGFRVFCQAARERDFATNPPEGKRDRLAALRELGYELAGVAKYRARGWLTRR